ncbi:MAG: DUF1028 domain-containing protein [Actinobacteria bacterium]|nr:DUF1028 domain-containing protein [Actinomycetota bacterium]
MRTLPPARRGLIVSAASVAVVLLTSTPSLADYSIVAVDPKQSQVGVVLAGCDATEVAHAPVIVPVNGAAVSGIERSTQINELLKFGLQTGKLPSMLLEDAAAKTSGKEQSLAVATRRYGAAVLTKSTNTHFSPTSEDAQATVSVQGSNLASDSVESAATAAFNKAAGTLADKLLAALRAAEDAGGDAACSKEATAAALLLAKPGDSLYNAYEWFTPSDDPKNVIDLKETHLPSVFISTVTKSGSSTSAVDKVMGLAKEANFSEPVRVRANAYIDDAKLNRFIMFAFAGALIAGAMIVIVMRRNRASASGSTHRGNKRSGNPAKR